MSEKVKQLHVDKRLIEDKYYKTDTQNSDLNNKLNNVDKSLHFIREKNKEELDVFKTKVGILESKIRNYSLREIQIQSEMAKKEKENEDLKDEIKRLMKPLQQKSGLEPFEFNFGKGLWISYTLSSNTQKSNEDPICDLKEKSLNSVAGKLNLVLEKVKSYELIIENLIEKLKETYNGILGQVFNRLVSINLDIDQNMCLVERLNDHNNHNNHNTIESIKRTFDQYLIFEDNDLKYDLSNDRHANIKTSYANNCLKLSLCFNLFAQSHEIVEKNNNPEKLERLGELLSEYRALQSDINFLFASIISSERRHDSIEKIHNKLNKLQSIFNGLWKDDKNKVRQLMINAPETTAIQSEIIGIVTAKEENELKEVEIFNSNFSFELSHFSNLLNTLESQNDIGSNFKTYK